MPALYEHGPEKFWSARPDGTRGRGATLAATDVDIVGVSCEAIDLMRNEWAWALAALVLGCSKATEPVRQRVPPAMSATGAASTPTGVPVLVRGATSSSGGAAVARAPIALDTAPYPWLSDSSVQSPAPVEPLEARFAAPEGYTRVPLADGSFGAWLRRLPLAAAGTPVRKYDGAVLLGTDHENLAAVIAIDSGRADLQQCADSVIRLHAEWMWSRGRRDMSYRAAAGTLLPYERWARGERIVPKGSGIAWVPSGKVSADHAGFRQFLDAVFAWANTVSLDRQARKVELSELRPGDFVILPGNPGHAVLFLDVASGPDGSRVALMGQGYMPAQGIYVLRPNRKQTWFEVRPELGAIETPFWAPFPWSALRRLDDS